MDIYLLKADGESAGPYGLDQTKAMLGSGKLTLETPCWTDGMSEWKPLREVLPACSVLSLAVVPMRPSGGDILANLTESPLIDGATNGCLSKIVLAVESIRRSEPDRANELFHASVAENHIVASGWLGIAYIDALHAGARRDALETLQYSLNQAGRHCPYQGVINDSCAQILAIAATKATLLAGRSYNSYANQFHASIRNLQAAERSVAHRNEAIFVGAIAGLLAYRSKGGLSKAIGYTIAASSGVRAVSSHLISREQMNAARENVEAAAQARQVALSAGYGAFQCLREAVRLYSRSSSYTQEKLASTAEAVSDVLASCCELEVRTFGIHLHELAGQIGEPGFVQNNFFGTTIIRSLLAVLKDFHLDHLPFYESVMDLFPSLNVIYKNADLQRSQRRAIWRRRLFLTLGMLLCLFGAALAVSSPALPQILSPWMDTDPPPALTISCLLAGVALFIAGVVRIVTANRAVLPIESAIAKRFARTWEAFETTSIRPGHFGLDPAHLRKTLT